MAKHTLLVAGASGVVGAAVLAHFAGLPDWQVIALARRAMPQTLGATYLQVDLTDPESCRTASAALDRVTHLFYTALFEMPELVTGWRDPRQMSTNLGMLRNLLDALHSSSPKLRHITLMQGAKAYGGHVEPAPVPCRESQSRHPHENFYWLQEDLLRERQAEAAWTFSVLRPQVVFGHAVSSPMNIVAAFGAFAAIQRERAQPLGYPGGGRFVVAGSDSRLIARAAEFCATHEIAANETYNIVNGDMLVWQDLWQTLAEHFGMPAGPPTPMSLAAEMPTCAALWQQIVQRERLLPLTLEALVGSSWQFADRSLACGVAQPPDSILSGLKLRQHGFHDCIDTAMSLRHWLGSMQAERLLPN